MSQSTALTAENLVETFRAVLAGVGPLEGADIYIVQSKKIQLSIDESNQLGERAETDLGYSLRIFKDGKVAHRSGRTLTIEDLKNSVQECLANISHKSRPGFAKEFVPIEMNVDLGLGRQADPTFATISPEEKSNRLMNLKNNALKIDPRLKQCRVDYKESMVREWIWYFGSQKPIFSDRTEAFVQIDLTAAQDDEVTRVTDEICESNYYDLDWSLLARRAAQKALHYFGASPLEQNQVKRLIVQSSASAYLLSEYSKSFMAQSEKKPHLLEALVGKVVFSDQLSLIDDPHLRKKIHSAFWDAETEATRRVDLVRQGSFLSLAHTRLTAELAGVPSTANAVRSSIESEPKPGFRNLTLEPGGKDYIDLVHEMENGLVIQHISAFSTEAFKDGLLSFTANGLRIENKKESAPFKDMVFQIPLLDFLKKISSVGRDMATYRGFQSPSLYFKDLF